MMKKLNKILLTCGGVLLLSGGAIFTYMQAQSREQLSDLTLANIEALAGGEASVVGCRHEDGSRCYVFSPNGVLVDKVRNAYPG